MTLPVGTRVVIARKIGTITRVGKNGNTHGYWVNTTTGDYGARSGLASFAAEHTVRPAIVGTTICPTPWGACFCGLTHVTTPTDYPGATWCDRCKDHTDSDGQCFCDDAHPTREHQ